MNARDQLIDIIYREMRDMGYPDEEARDIADVVAVAIISNGWPPKDEA
jgi:hypothetical protein